MGVLNVLRRDAGDETIAWDPEDPDQVRNAHEQFDFLRRDGHLAYTLNKEGRRGVQVLEFDPTLERIILSPAPQGG